MDDVVTEFADQAAFREHVGKWARGLMAEQLEKFVDRRPWLQRLADDLRSATAENRERLCRRAAEEIQICWDLYPIRKGGS